MEKLTATFVCLSAGGTSISFGIPNFKPINFVQSQTTGRLNLDVFALIALRLVQMIEDSSSYQWDRVHENVGETNTSFITFSRNYHFLVFFPNIEVSLSQTFLSEILEIHA